MPFNRLGATQLVVRAIKPYIDTAKISGGEPRTEEEVVEALILGMEEEPYFGAAFQAMVEAIWDLAQAEAKQGNYRET